MTDPVLFLHLALGVLFFVVLLVGRAHAWRTPVLVVALLLALTGAYNFMTRLHGAPRYWHALIGVKILLALHVIAMSVLLARGTNDAQKAARWRKGALISGAVVILIGLILSNPGR